ncbi:MAG: metallophosphoesterase, partial [Gammaproteobacteria bacterium]
HFVMITGDFIAHNYQQDFQQYTGDMSQQDYQQFVSKTYEYLLLQLRETFPGTPVYFTLGNNDSYNGDYYSDPDGAFYQNMARLWQMVIPDAENKQAFESTFPHDGYFVIKPEADENNKIVFLNSNLFSAKATGNQIATALQQQLSWLQQQLDTAHSQHQHVWLVYHIPNGADVYNCAEKHSTVMLWQKQANAGLMKVLNQYPDVVTAIFSAHVHMDGYQLVHLRDHTTVLNTFIPAVSPIYDNNPAFKTYQYDSHTFALGDAQTYYRNQGTGIWQQEYDFNKIYQPYCEQCSLLQGYQTIKKAGWRAEQYQEYYGVSTNSQPITQGDWGSYYWCGIQRQAESGYNYCLNHTAS